MTTDPRLLETLRRLATKAVPNTMPTSLCPEGAAVERIEQLDAEVDRLNKVVEGAKMARTRLERFADQANAGRVHHDARELKRRVWASFADFDAAITAGDRDG